MKRVAAIAAAVVVIAVAAGAFGAALAGTKSAAPPGVYTGEAEAYPDHLLGYVTLPAADLYAPHAKGTIATVGGRPYSDAVAAIADSGFLVTSVVQGGLPNASCNPDAPPCVNQVPTYVNSVYPTGPGPKNGCVAPTDRGTLCDATRLSAGPVQLLRSHADADCKGCPDDARPTSLAEVGVSGFEVPGQLKIGAHFASQRQFIDDKGVLRVRAESLLKDVNVAGVLKIASVTAVSEASGGADDRSKKANSTVSMTGVSLAGQALHWDEKGLRVGGSPATVDPVAARAQVRALLDQLAKQGIDIDVGLPAVGGVKKAGKVESAATALTIHFRPRAVPQSVTQDYVLGYARAAVSASDTGAASLPPPLNVVPLIGGASPSGLSTPAVSAVGGSLGASPGTSPLLGESPTPMNPRATRRRVRARPLASAFGAPDAKSARRLSWVVGAFGAVGLLTPVAALALRHTSRRQQEEWRR